MLFRALPVAAAVSTALTMLGLGLLPSAAAADLPANDNYVARAPIAIDSTVTASNTQAGIESVEQLTVNDATHRTCGSNGSPDDAFAKGSAMGGTLWWSVAGDGRPITVSTDGSDFDTVVGVYDVDGIAFQGCNDNASPTGSSAPRTTSEVTVPTVAGHQYVIQVGGCARSPQGCSSKTTGNISLTVTAPPAASDPGKGSTGGGPTGASSAPTSGKRPPLKTSLDFHYLNYDRKTSRASTKLDKAVLVKTPGNARITIRCSGKGCSFKRKTLKTRKTPKGGRLSILKYVSQRYYRKATLTIDVTKANRRGIRSRLTMLPREVKVAKRATNFG